MLKDRAIEVKENVKNHIKRNKNKYYVAGLVGVAGVSIVVTRRITLAKFIAVDGTTTIVTKASVRDNGALYNIFNIYPVGMKNQGPSWMVKCKENGVLYKSQEEAARNLGLNASEISKHLNSKMNPGKMDHVRGYHFERMGVAA